jgi:hypothetical protein
MIDTLIDIGLAGVMLLAIYGVGCAVWRLVPLRAWSASADLALALASGIGTISTVLFALALIGMLRVWAAWGIVIIGIGLALWQWRAIRDDARSALRVVRDAWGASWFGRAALMIAAIFILMNVVGDLVPPLEGDTVHQYLLTSREWAAVGRYVQPAHIWASTLPGNMMMISAWALVLGGTFSLAALVIGFGFSLFFAAAVYALARQYFEPIPALLGAIVAYTMPDVGYLAQSAKVDMGWAFFEVLALAAFFRWMDASRPISSDAGWDWLGASGALLGLAAGSKNQTFISIALLGAWLVLRMGFRGDVRGMIKGALIFGGAVVATGFPYYLYNGVMHANPFYPVFADVFAKWGGTASPRSELGTEIFYDWTVGGYLTNLWNMSLGHEPTFYLGFITGPLMLLAIPVSLMMGLMRRIMWRMIGYAFAFSVVWFLVKQAARHFLPGLVLLAIIAGYVLWRLTQAPSMLRRVVLIAAVICLLGNIGVWAGVFYWSKPYRVISGQETRTQFLARIHDKALTEDFPDWATIEYLNAALTSEDRVLTVHAGSLLYITPQVVSGNWGDRLAYDRITSEDALLEALNTHHIKYILIYQIDDSNAVPLFASPAFLTAHAERVYEGPRTSLYRIVRAGE